MTPLFRIIDLLAKPSARSSASLGSVGMPALRKESRISDDQEMMLTIGIRTPIKPSAILERFMGSLPLVQSVDQQRDLKEVSLAGLRSSTLPGNTQMFLFAIIRQIRSQLPKNTKTQNQDNCQSPRPHRHAIFGIKVGATGTAGSSSRSPTAQPHQVSWQTTTSISFFGSRFLPNFDNVHQPATIQLPTKLGSDKVHSARQCFHRSDHDRLAFLYISVYIGVVAEADVRI
ncbi:hypothetical protein CcaCcLH18_00681 [Colletotrichum camelliae]|nr:hypothetical protein CcaCcLH18_00681 [Colletotrichum camelliae]